MRDDPLSTAMLPIELPLVNTVVEAARIARQLTSTALPDCMTEGQAFSHAFYSYSKDDFSGEGRSNRMRFLDAFMYNLKVKFKLSEKEFKWVAAEEFGISANGHWHILFSFDELKAKGREDKIPLINFAENGEFHEIGEESKDFVCRKLGLKPSTVDFHWSKKTKND
ncbi:MAG: hypothetical protein WCH43_13275, partial [Verrucomicrobiota bacterium]